MDNANDEEQETKKKQKQINNAKIYTNCFGSAALAIANLHSNQLDADTVMDRLIKSAKKINNGDIGEIENMLMTQAKMLDYLFYDSIDNLAHLKM